MKILITGASGFVGKELTLKLKDSRHEIHRLVRTPLGEKSEYTWNFFDTLPKKLPKCDVVIHLAAHVDFGTDFNPKTYLTNTGGTAQLVSYARENEAYFVFTSMAGIHGAAEYIDSNTPISLINNYAVSKYLAERIVTSQLTNYSILRISGIYGLDGPSHLGLNNALSNAFYKNEIPVLHGQGLIKRNYICVNDVVNWIEHLLKKSKSSKQKVQEVTYVGGAEILSIREYLEAIASQMFGDTSKIIIRDGKPGQDFVVTTSPPIMLTTFSEYLDGLMKKKAAQGSAR